MLVDWGDAAGSRWLDVAFALLSVRAEGGRPPPIDFPEEGGFAARLAGHDAWSATQPPKEWMADWETLRAAWVHDFRHALPWAVELLGLPPPPVTTLPGRACHGRRRRAVG